MFDVRGYKIYAARAVVLAFVILLGGAVHLTAQRLRLRSQSVPPCSTSGGSSNLKFADLFGDGNIAVVGTYSCRGGFIYDISNPDSPILASWYNPGNNQQFLEAIIVGNRAYFGSGNGGGVHIVDVTNPYSPVLLGTVDSAHGSGHNSIHEMMVIAQGSSTFLIENYNSTSVKSIRVIDITNPAAPVFKWEFNPTDVTWVHAFHIRGNRMYTSGWGGKIEIYDIGDLAAHAPALLGAITGNSTNHSTWTSEDGRYLYSCRETFDGDLRVYDVQDPSAPMLVRAIKAADLGINAISPHNPVVMGNYLYISWYQAGIQVFDISDPTTPKRVAQYDTYAPTFAPTDEQIKVLQTEGPWDAICGSPNGLRASALPSSYDGNWSVYPFLGQNKILAGDLANGLFVLDASAVAAPQRNLVSDYDGDRKTDLSAYSPSTGVWYFMNSVSGFGAAQFGSNGDVPVPADFDADGKTDIAVWRPSTGVWYIQQSTLGFRAVQWGTAGDKPLTGDFEGDGKPDITVWRPSNGVWYTLQSSSSIPMYAAFGTNGDRPLLGDFDGNGASDYAVYRPSDGTWYLLDPITRAFSSYRFGLAEDVPVPADYDGDGKTDVAVFRPSQNTWFRLNSSNGAFFARVFGQSGDKPAPSSVQP